MKTVKIFIASSNELKEERDAFDVFVNQFNSQFHHKAIFLDLIKWENLDASMGVEHKQAEYNKILEECDICVVLFWKKYGEYTESELLKAYNRFVSGEKPYKLHIYFKGADNGELSEDLKLFKDSFSEKYGNISCNFQNIDTMRLNFLLHLYNHKVIEEGALNVDSEKVLIDGREYVSLNNIPFAANNDQFKELKTRLEKINAEIAKYREKYNQTQNDTFLKLINKCLSQKKELEETFDELQKSLFNTALVITSMYGKRSSVRLKLAIEKFESGDSAGANAILDPTEIEADARAIIESYKRGEQKVEDAQNAIRSNIEELLLKIKVAVKENHLNTSVEECITYFNNAISLANKVELPQEECAVILTEYGAFLKENTRYIDAIKQYSKVLEVYELLSTKNHELYLQSKADIQMTIGDIYSIDNSIGDAQAMYSAALDSYTTLSCDYGQDFDEMIDKLTDLI